MEFLIYAVKDTDTDYTFDLTLLGYGANEAIPVHDIWNPDSEPFVAMGILTTKVPNHGVKLFRLGDKEPNAIKDTSSNATNLLRSFRYDLQGRPLMTPTKGLYVENGKLIIKK